MNQELAVVIQSHIIYVILILAFVLCRQYPEGWNADPGRDSQLEYRLSIFHASKDDSGVFTCETPTRHAHSIEIVVTGNCVNPSLRNPPFLQC